MNDHAITKLALRHCYLFCYNELSMKQTIADKQLEILTCGTTIYLTTISLTAIWSKNYSSSKLFYDSPQIVALLCSLGCFIASVLFSFALACNGKKLVFIPALVVSIITGIVGLLLFGILNGIANLGAQ